MLGVREPVGRGDAIDGLSHPSVPGVGWEDTSISRKGSVVGFFKGSLDSALPLGATVLKDGESG